MFTYRRGNDLINKKIWEKKIKKFSSVMCLVLIMTNVTGCRASKVADMFGTSVESAGADKDGRTDDLSDTAGTEIAANSTEAEASGPAKSLRLKQSQNQSCRLSRFLQPVTALWERPSSTAMREAFIHITTSMARITFSQG